MGQSAVRMGKSKHFSTKHSSGGSTGCPFPSAGFQFKVRELRSAVLASYVELRIHGNEGGPRPERHWLVSSGRVMQGFLTRLLRQKIRGLFPLGVAAAGGGVLAGSEEDVFSKFGGRDFRTGYIDFAAPASIAMLLCLARIEEKLIFKDCRRGRMGRPYPSFVREEEIDGH